MLNGLLNSSPKWLSFFQKGKPGDTGYYLNLKVGTTYKLYGPIKSRAYAYVLSALVFNEPTMWPDSRAAQTTLGRGVGLYDSPEELEALVQHPDDYGYSAVKLLRTSRLKLNIGESDALMVLRTIDYPESGYHHFFGFTRPSDERELFPFAYDAV